MLSQLGPGNVPQVPDAGGRQGVAVLEPLHGRHPRGEQGGQVSEIKKIVNIELMRKLGMLTGLWSRSDRSPSLNPVWSPSPGQRKWRSRWFWGVGLVIKLLPGQKIGQK